MAEVTSQQIEQLTKALEGVEKRLAGGGGSGGGGGGGSGSGDQYVKDLGGSIKKASGDFIGAMGTGSISLTKLTESSMDMVKMAAGDPDAAKVLKDVLLYPEQMDKVKLDEFRILMTDFLVTELARADARELPSYLE